MKLHQFRLDELGTVSRGRSRHRPRDAEHLYDGPYPFVQTGDIKDASLYLNEYTQTYSEARIGSEQTVASRHNVHHDRGEHRRYRNSRN